MDPSKLTFEQITRLDDIGAALQALDIAVHEEWPRRIEAQRVAAQDAENVFATVGTTREAWNRGITQPTPNSFSTNEQYEAAMTVYRRNLDKYNREYVPELRRTRQAEIDAKTKLNQLIDELNQMRRLLVRKARVMGGENIFAPMPSVHRDDPVQVPQNPQAIDVSSASKHKEQTVNRNHW